MRGTVRKGDLVDSYYHNDLMKKAVGFRYFKVGRSPMLNFNKYQAP